MENQTAVNWLKDKLPSIFIDDKNGFYRKLFEQALAMEKEQIVDAYGTKTSKTTQQGIDVYQITNGEHYYNETYKK
jgi:hypothetical protein